MYAGHCAQWSGRVTTLGLGGVLGDGLAGGGVGPTIDGAVVGAVDAPPVQAARNAPKPAIAEPCRKPRRVIGRVPPAVSSNMSSSSTPPGHRRAATRLGFAGVPARRLMHRE